jgi:hypothetical protein
MVRGGWAPRRTVIRFGPAAGEIYELALLTAVAIEAMLREVSTHQPVGPSPSV